MKKNLAALALVVSAFLAKVLRDSEPPVTRKPAKTCSRWLPLATHYTKTPQNV